MSYEADSGYLRKEDENDFNTWWSHILGPNKSSIAERRAAKYAWNARTADLAAAQERLRDTEEVLADQRQLTRELDIALCGEENAAKQASLCDLIAPARELRRRLREVERRLPCGHPAEFDDSYGGCVFCQYREGYLEYEEENTQLEARVEALELVEKTANRLVQQLDHIHKDNFYRAVWESYAMHVAGGYVGPQYVEELQALRDALAGVQGKPDEQSTL